MIDPDRIASLRAHLSDTVLFTPRDSGLFTIHHVGQEYPRFSINIIGKATIVTTSIWNHSLYVTLAMARAFPLAEAVQQTGVAPESAPPGTHWRRQQERWELCDPEHHIVLRVEDRAFALDYFRDGSYPLPLTNHDLRLIGLIAHYLQPATAL